MQYYLTRDVMFDGKNLVAFWEQYRYFYKFLIERYGIEKMLKVYNWTFRMLQNMEFGQWAILDKICPDKDNRFLLYFCLEHIYQSDMLSQFAWEEDKLVCVEPTKKQRKRCREFYSADGRHYILNDWFNRLLRCPDCFPGIKPEWITLGTEGGEIEQETYSENPDEE